MARLLKRVPLDFNYPINKKWEGYCPSIEKFQKLFGDKYPILKEYTHVRDICSKCQENFGDCSEDADYCFWYCDDKREKWYYDVPKGEGYQLWEDTTEGSPKSPVFETLEELCEWLADNNVSWFAKMTMTKEEWLESLSKREYLMPIFTLLKE